ncbi:hypothetical protein [Sphingomonas sp.]|uniref:lipase family protein n=1 Tax=Sphingomonas sp. TaxID=28214 RepID=UPI001B03FA55|nr:hypothetical protein [Sphingomonas sp.]MBO9712321.1 hypothetical protein [Sphingomonas sp.]
MQPCLKRRLLYACSQAYRPKLETIGRPVGWLEPPLVIERDLPLAHRPIDAALVGRVPEGVLVSFRGTLPPFFGRGDGWTVVLDWLNDGLSLCVDDPDYAGGVHLGFADSMKRLWEDCGDRPGLRSAVTRMLDQSLLDRRARPHLFVTGHSKGGALANLFAFRAATRADWAHLPISVATIAAARTGNSSFARAYAATRIACLRYELPSDLVPHLPPGPHTPGWAVALLRQFWPRFSSADFQPVGLKISGGTTHHQPWLGARQPRRLAGLLRPRHGFEALMPAMLAAHAICPDSGYDRLVCTGEDCDHGAADPRHAGSRRLS